MTKNGFTLIELIAAVTISLLVGIGAMVAVNDFNGKEKSKAVADVFLEELRMARNYAVTSQTPPGFPADKSLAYVEVRHTNGTLEITAVASDDNRYQYPSSVKSIGAPATVQFSPFVFPDVVYFSVFKGSLMKYDAYGNKVNLTDPGDTATITIVYQSNTKRVYVTSSGQIYSQ